MKTFSQNVDREKIGTEIDVSFFFKKKIYLRKGIPSMFFRRPEHHATETEHN